MDYVVTKLWPKSAATMQNAALSSVRMTNVRKKKMLTLLIFITGDVIIYGKYIF